MKILPAVNGENRTSAVKKFVRGKSEQVIDCQMRCQSILVVTFVSRGFATPALGTARDKFEVGFETWTVHLPANLPTKP
jgi:hypothetical protein